MIANNSKNYFERASVRELKTNWVKDKGDIAYLNTILKSDVYQNCQTYREQCHILWQYLNFFHWSKNKVARLLDVDHKCFEKQINLPLEVQPPGRPNALNEDEIQLLLLEIGRLIDLDENPTLYDLQQYIIEQTGKAISPDTIKNYILNNGYKTILGDPMEDSRVSVRDEDIDNYFNFLGESINDTPASLVYNMDEAGEDDYVDTHGYYVIVPSDFKDKTKKVPVRRNSKRATLINCICSDGTYMKPLIIIPRKTVDSQIFKKLTLNNVLIKSQKNGYANTELIQTT